VTEDGTGVEGPREPLAVVFDLDDTLVVSTVDFAKFRRLVIERIVEWGDERAAYSANETIVVIIRRAEDYLKRTGLSEDDIKARLAELDRIMDAVEMERVDETAPLDGAPEVLRELRARGLRIGVLTRGCESYARYVLEKTGMTALVDALEARNSETRPKPDPESYLRLVKKLGVRPEDSIFVGDHPIDAECAMMAGVMFIGVGTGDVPDDRMKAAGCSVCLKDVGGLTAWMDEHFH